MKGQSRVNARTERDWNDHGARKDGEWLNVCRFRLNGEPPCARPIRTYVARCSEHQALVNRFWRELEEELAASRPVGVQ